MTKRFRKDADADRSQRMERFDGLFGRNHSPLHRSGSKGTAELLSRYPTSKAAPHAIRTKRIAGVFRRRRILKHGSIIIAANELIRSTFGVGECMT